MSSVAFQSRRWVFQGKVTPDLPIINLVVPRHQAEVSLGFRYELEARIYWSKLIATVWQHTEVDLFTLRNAVCSDVQLSLDVLALRLGAGLELELISAVADDGAWQFFDGYIPSLRRDGQVDLSPEFLAATGNDPASHSMLADFRAAMRWPMQTGFFCYRAAEAGMQTFKRDETAKDAATWELMRQALRIERSAIDAIKAHADWARHGRTGQLTDQDRVGLLTTTRAIVERYLDFIVGGRKPLSPELPAVVWHRPA